MRVLHVLRDLGLTGVPRFVELFCASNLSKENLENFIFTTDEGLLKENINNNAVFLGYKKKIKYSLFPLLLLLYHYYSKRINVLHIHINPWGLIFVYFMNSPAVLTMHVLPKAVGIEGKLLNFLLRKLSKRKNCMLVAVSNIIAEESAKILGIEYEKIEVIYNGIKLPDEGRPLIRNEIRNRSIKLGQVGSLSVAKGQFYAIKAASILKEKGYNFKIYFAGEGPLRAELEKTVNEYKLKSNIEFLGNILFDEFIKIYAPDAIILPSISETFGFAIIEAWSYGVPIVASRVQGPMEIITDGYSGLLVEPANEVDLTNKIEIIIKDDLLRNNLINGGFKDLIKFDIEKTVMNYYSIYKHLVAQ